MAVVDLTRRTIPKQTRQATRTEVTAKMQSSSSDTEVAIAVLTATTAVATAVGDGREAHTYGSRPNRAGNRDLGRDAAATRLDRDFFNRTTSHAPLFSEAEFERSYRMPRVVYELIRTKLLEHDAFFRQERDATGRLGASTDVKLAAAIRMLAEGCSAFSLVQSLRISEPLVMKCLKRFSKAMVECFEGEWLRRPNTEELKKIEERYSALGFPGCIGCVDCAGWAWDACPIAWQGLFKGKDNKPTCRMEVVCDDNLRIWHLSFGIPGSRNDKSIFDHSSFFNDLRSDRWPAVRPELCISGYYLRKFYLLADGIYPRYLFLALPHPNPTTRKEKLYSAHHASARKAVERVFGVLFKQFRILYLPSRLWHVETMESVAKTCCILHNMVASNRGYVGTMQFRDDDANAESQARPLCTEEVEVVSCQYEQAALWRQYIDGTDDAQQHNLFTSALIEHVWNKAGDAP